MPDRDWRAYTPAGVGIGILFLLMLATLGHHQQKTGRAEYAARQEYEQSKEVAPVGASSQGQYTDPKAYREEWRAERDLQAQRDMARWALLLLIATVIGVVLLAATLFETRRAAEAAATMVDEARKTTAQAKRTNEIAREALLSDRRAWLKVEIEINGRFIRQGSDLTLHLKYIVNNVGNSPATQVHITCSPLVFADELPDFPAMHKGFCDRIRMEERQSGLTVFSTIPHIEEMGVIKRDFPTDIVSGPDKLYSIFISGCVTYKTIGIEENRQSRVLYILNKGRNGDECFQFGDTLVPPENLKLVRLPFGQEAD